jgi:hypothetical protein
MTRTLHRPVLIALVLGASLPTFAGSGHDHHQHNAHVHGEARLELVLEGNTLEMAFHSPAHNLLGFEHEPRTDDERQRTTAAIATLKKGDTLFSLDGGDCTLQEASVNQQAPTDKHDKHDHQHSSDPETHREFEAQYRYQCTAADTLRRIQIDLTKAFPGVEKITAEWIFNARQGRKILSGGAATIEVK